MAEKYFDKFSIINYGGKSVRNITQRAVVLNSVYTDPTLYYPYDIAQYERPDNIADRYYSDQYASWILLLTNKVIDPYYDWYIDDETFRTFLIKKYGSSFNALNKIKYYRNNWYTQTDPIGVAQYNALPASLVKFFEPQLVNGEVPLVPLNYVRRREDWTHSTNKVVRLSTTTGTGFIKDEIVEVTLNGSLAGRAQVAFSNSTTLSVQHVVGTIHGTVTSNSFVVGLESGVNAAFTASTLVLDNIPTEETTYWSPVTCYEYESEINEKNKSILVLNKNYAPQISKQLKSILR